MKPGGSPGDEPTKPGQCKTAEELMKLVGKYNITLTEEEAAALLRLMRPPVGELGEGELEEVSGGIHGSPGICPHCGVWFDWMRVNDFYFCLNCGFRKGP